jgi:hypothetical protein
MRAIARYRAVACAAVNSKHSGDMQTGPGSGACRVCGGRDMTKEEGHNSNWEERTARYVKRPEGTEGLSQQNDAGAADGSVET